MKIMKWLANYFRSYFWIGIIILAGAVITEQVVIMNKNGLSTGIVINIILNFTKSLGIAILIASIFTFVSGTGEFLAKIRSLLKDIVIDRNFLGNIDVNSKEKALSAIIKASDEEKTIYANVEDYYNFFIRKILAIQNVCVRSDYHTKSYIYYDNDKEKLAVKHYIHYRLHPTKNGYSAITFGYYINDCHLEVEKIIINSPDGKRDEISTFDWVDTEKGGIPAKLTKIDLKKFDRLIDSHLNITIFIKEYGFDHWIAITWSALEPTDGFSFCVECDDKISIRNYTTYIHGAKFNIDRYNKKELMLSCSQWFNEGTGISVVASIDNDKDTVDRVE